MGKAETPDTLRRVQVMRHRETLVLATLLSACDAKASARALRSPMLTYLAEMLVEEAQSELAKVRRSAGPPRDPGCSEP